MKLWPFGKKEDRASLENPGVSLADPRALQVLFGGAESEAGVTVTRENALSVPAFWQGVNFLSSTIASLPLHVYQDVDGQRQRDNGPIDRMLNVAANESLTSFRWRKKVMMDTLTEGRSYTFVRRNRAGQPRDLFPLDPNAVTLRIQGGEMFYDYTPLSDKSGRSKTTYTADQIIDIPWALESDGYTHINPVVKLRNALGLAIALETYGARFFNSGGIPPVALQGPPMSPAAAKRAGTDVKNAISDAVKQGRPPVMPEGFELKSIGVDPEKSQMNEARRFQIEEIARILDLPPVFLHDLTKGTFNNTEQAALNLVKHTLRQWLVAIEQEINLKLFRRTQQNTRFAEFNVDGLLRGDFATRMGGMAQGIQNGMLTPNEARQMENREPKDGGDSLHLQQNMMDLQSIGEPDGSDGEA